MKNRFKIGVFFLLGILSNTHLNAQKDTTSSDHKTDGGFIFRPKVGLGVGSFTFIGDVANNYKGGHLTVSRLAYDIRLTNPLSDNFDLNFYALFGTLSANERTPSRNLNFQSYITTGGATVGYNFGHFLPEKRKVEPYLTIGIESVEFLSKTDLYDRFGNKYHYWSDGSIRNLAEDAPNADEAIFLQRDYIYETDLRELNLDGKGKYSEITWAIPVGLYANFKLGERVNFRIGSSMHFTFTDHIDGVHGDGEGIRAGTKGNDKFLFTSFYVDYDFYWKKGDKKPKEFDLKSLEFDDLLAQDTIDSDGDGIVDHLDKCAKTPLGVEVDQFGCPLDSDGDGVPDYMDDELDTPRGNLVNERGVSLTEEDFLQAYLVYIDSTGKFQDMVVVRNTYQSQGVTRYGSGGMNKDFQDNKKYTVIIGSEEKSVDYDELHKLLAEKDFKTIESGDTIYYVIGAYDNLEDAVREKGRLEESGFDVKGVAQTTPDKEKNEIKIKTIPNSSLPEIAKVESSEAVNLYRVQIGAFKSKVAPSTFANVPDLLVVSGEDGITRYYSGSFKSKSAATNRQLDMVSQGYQGSFIVAYKEGKRLTLKEAGFEVEANAVDTKVETPTPMSDNIDKSKIKFRVQVGAYKNEIPTEVLDVYLQVGNILPKRDLNSGLVKYYTKAFSTYEEADGFKEEVIREGLYDAFVVGEFDNNIISTSEAFKLLNQ
ncbi:MAG: SPOR domain-containing protein [Flavobacteriales bacterium]